MGTGARAASADGDRGDADVHGHIGIGGAFAESFGDAHGFRDGDCGLDDGGIFGGVAGGADADHFGGDGDGTAIFPALVLFGDGFLERGFEFFVSASREALSAERISTSIQASKGMALTEVPPPTRPTLKVVLGLVGTSKSSIFAMARPIAWMGLAMPNAP